MGSSKYEAFIAAERILKAQNRPLGWGHGQIAVWGVRPGMTSLDLGLPARAVTLKYSLPMRERWLRMMTFGMARWSSPSGGDAPSVAVLSLVSFIRIPPRCALHVAPPKK